MVLGISEDTEILLERLANKKRVSKIEIVRRALALYFLLEDELQGRRSLAIVNSGDQIVSKISYL